MTIYRYDIVTFNPGLESSRVNPLQSIMEKVQIRANDTGKITLDNCVRIKLLEQNETVDLTEEVAQQVNLVQQADESLAAPAEEQCVSPQNYEVVPNKSGLEKFPNIEIPGMALTPIASGVNPLHTAYSIVRIAPKFGPHSLFMTVVCALAVGLVVYEWVYNRSETEKSFRSNVDQAQLSALNDDEKRAVTSWRAAIENAISLGDNPKLIGDLYMETAKSECNALHVLKSPEESKTLRQQIFEDLHNALALYEKARFTILPQIQAHEQ
ncbi:MAG: hypothetical protein JST44_02280, partial [Cyanobacteria bacterium SZAS LIN-5]|nr:hypothetical protein [Cyanobacteria bacterium SZAS LIN-5]